jgi:hypothetical protein
MAEDDRIPYSKTRMLTREELGLIRKMKNVKFAMHGIFHRTIEEDYLSEFIGLEERKLESKIKIGLNMFKKYKIKTDILVPPFNTFDLSNLQVFKKYFKIVTGGPETIKIFGKIPTGNLDGIMFIPSYKPYYGKGKNIYKAISKVKETENIKKPICIAFHWGWEIENNFKYVKKICDLIKNKVMKWDFNTLQTLLY